MGVVYRAAHALLRRPAAIKLLSNERTSDRDQARFEREVQLTSRLAHPNTIAIFDYGRTADGVFYYVMEYLDGLDLDRLVKQEGPLPPPRAVHILAQICAALSEAHALGLVHRDVKPANVVLTDRVDEPDIVKVVDFGLARALTPNPEESQHGAITGTPLYLAPEAISAPATADARADIYAVGAVAYYLLSGRNVFEAPTVIETLGQHMLKEPTAPSAHLGAPLSEDLEELVLGCLSKDPARRPQSTADLRASLLACKDAALYDRAAALAWWKDFRAAPRRTAQTRDSSSVTMAVDLETRQQTRRTA
jgi:serine/threonine protein kinase